MSLVAWFLIQWTGILIRKQIWTKWDIRDTCTEKKTWENIRQPSESQGERPQN